MGVVTLEIRFIFCIAVLFYVLNPDCSCPRQNGNGK